MALISGDNQDNHLFGYEENDIIEGLGGNDFLFGGRGDDTLVGGQGNDQLDGFEGNNTYVFARGDGQDTIMSYDPTASKLNTISFAAGIAAADVVLSRTNNDLILQLLASEDIIIVRNHFEMHLDPYHGLIQRQWGIERITFANGDSWNLMDIRRLIVPAATELGGGDDFAGGVHLNGNGGDDQLTGFPNAILNGGDGNDTLIGGTGNPVLNGGRGNDLLMNFSDATLLFQRGWGQDRIDTQYGYVNDVRFGGVLPSELAVVRSDGGSGADLILRSLTSDDTLTLVNYFGGNGQPSQQGKFAITFANGVSWGDHQLQMALNFPPLPELSGTPGGDQLFGSSLNDVLRGNGGNDIFYGGAGNDVLIGGSGNEIMSGDEGDDIFMPGAGDAVIRLQGNDGILFGRDAGTYLLEQMWQGNVTVVLAEDVGPGDLQVEYLRNGEITLVIPGSAARLVMPDIILFDPVMADKIKVLFADGTMWSGADVREMIFTGTDLGDYLDGTPMADVMRGLGGDDQLLGSGGDDTLYGGEGNDLLRGGSGNDHLYGGAGDDHLFGEGDDDVIEGGAGNDFMGGEGHITYRFDGQHGNDTVFLQGPDWNGTRSDTFQLGAGIDPDALGVLLIGWRTLLLTTSEGNSIRMENFSFDDETPMLLQFADGSSWDRAKLRERSLIGNEGDNQIVGGDSDDALVGKGGMDMLDGMGGNDMLSGGDGDDILRGGDGDDTLDGGAGMDLLEGGFGADIYVFALGDGVDAISEYSVAPQDNAVIRFGAGIAQADLELSAHSQILTIRYGAGDAIEVRDFDPQSAHSQRFLETRVEFADGKVSTLADLFMHAPEVGLPLVPPLAKEGQSYVWHLPHGAFTDTDAVDFQLSYELTMKEGGPLPAWIQFDGVGGFSGTPGLSDSGVLHLQLTAIDKQGHRVATTFSLTVENTNQAPLLAQPVADQATANGVAFSLTLPEQMFTDPDAGDTGTMSVAGLPEWMSFDSASGTFSGTPGWGDAATSAISVTWTDAGGLSATDTFSVTVAALPGLNLTGTAGADTLTGLAGDDTLTGLGGNDILDGAQGADTMRGGLGNDTCHVDHPGDIVLENGNEGVDTVISAIGYTLGANLERLILSGSASADATGNALNNTLTGNAGANVLDGGAGADAMSGGDGHDTYLVDNGSDSVVEASAGGGFDHVMTRVGRQLGTNQEALTLTGTAAISGSGNALANVIRGNDAVNSLNGGLGGDILQGGGGDDNMSDGSAAGNLFDGGLGADRLSGGSGADMFIGGAGNDSITTGTGADIIAFNRGDGADAVSVTSGSDNTVSLGKGIRYADLVLSKSGNDLLLSTGGADQIAFKGWYSSTDARSVGTLQVMTEGGDYQAGSASVLTDHKVELFDFRGLVAAFDAARAATPSMQSWSMAWSMSQFSTGGSDSAAIGGDLAYQYALHGSLSTLSAMPALALIGSPAFGSGMQDLQDGSALNDGVVVLY